VFVVYAVLLAIGTHWPNARIPAPEGLRPDLLIHVVALGLWTVLLTASGLLGPATAARTAAAAALVATGYSILDEATQAIPALGRTAALDDWMADILGVAIGAGACLVAARGGSARSGARSGSDGGASE